MNILAKFWNRQIPAPPSVAPPPLHIDLIGAPVVVQTANLAYHGRLRAVDTDGTLQVGLRAGSVAIPAAQVRSCKGYRRSVAWH